jgi:hypothetical protein
MTILEVTSIEGRQGVNSFLANIKARFMEAVNSERAEPVFERFSASLAERSPVTKTMASPVRKLNRADTAAEPLKQAVRPDPSQN